MEWADRSTMEGKWEHDKIVNGKMVNKDDKVYTGYFKDMKYDGIGKLEMPRDRLIFEGLFINGEL